MRPALVAA